MHLAFHHLYCSQFEGKWFCGVPYGTPTSQFRDKNILGPWDTKIENEGNGCVCNSQKIPKNWCSTLREWFNVSDSELFRSFAIFVLGAKTPTLWSIESQFVPCMFWINALQRCGSGPFVILIEESTSSICLHKLSCQIVPILHTLVSELRMKAVKEQAQFISSNFLDSTDEFWHPSRILWVPTNHHETSKQIRVSLGSCEPGPEFFTSLLHQFIPYTVIHCSTAGGVHDLPTHLPSSLCTSLLIAQCAELSIICQRTLCGWKGLSNQESVLTFSDFRNLFTSLSWFDSKATLQKIGFLNFPVERTPLCFTVMRVPTETGPFTVQSFTTQCSPFALQD